MSLKSFSKKASTFASTAAQKASDFNEKARSTTEGAVVNGVQSTAEWITKAAESAMGLLEKARPALPEIPPLFRLCRIMYLPGMSAIALAGGIINELSRRGFNMEVNFDGTRNCIVEFVETIAEQVVQHIKDNAFGSGMVTTAQGVYPFRCDVN